MHVGLHPAAKESARVHSDDSGNSTVENGPFDGPSLGGYAVINVADLNEAIELVKGFPHAMPGNTVEIRRVVDINDLPLPDEVKAKAKQLRYVICQTLVTIVLTEVANSWPQMPRSFMLRVEIHMMTSERVQIANEVRINTHVSRLSKY
jgi:hypothetical protein